MVVSNRFWKFCFLLILGIGQIRTEAKPKVQALTEFEGLQTSFYSEVNGKLYLSLKYESSQTRRSKIGFLKFAMSFLEIQNFRASLDLRHAVADGLFSKWNDLLSQRSIRYATMEPIEITVIDLEGRKLELRAGRGKFNSEGQLLLWQKVFLSYRGQVESLRRTSVRFDKDKKALVVDGGENKTIILLLAA